MKKKIFAIILGCIIHVSYAQNKPNNAKALICWQEGVKLKWRDFQATPTKGKSEFGATSAPGIDVDVFVDNKGKNNYLITCYFDRENSWVRDSAFVFEFALLAHEQLHFDIAEIIARKLRRKIYSYYLIGQDVFGDELGKEIECLLDEQIEWQTLYDKETEHGTIAEEQKRWAVLVKNQLAMNRLYKSTAATCK